MRRRPSAHPRRPRAHTGRQPDARRSVRRPVHRRRRLRHAVRPSRRGARLGRGRGRLGRPRVPARRDGPRRLAAWRLPARSALPARLGAAGAARLRRGAAARRPGGGPRRRDRRRAGHRRSAPTSRPARCCPCSPTARRCASCPSSPTARTPTSSSGSTTPPRPQADRINELAHARGESWIARYGGLISSEWEFAKGLQLLEEDPEVYDRMDHFVEAADWIVWQLTGRYVRNACTAGYKGIYQDGHYPDREFLAALEPRLRGLRRRQGRARDRSARRRRGHADRRGRGVDRPAGGHRRSRSATSTRTSPLPRRGRPSRARWSRSWAPRRAT